MIKLVVDKAIFRTKESEYVRLAEEALPLVAASSEKYIKCLSAIYIINCDDRCILFLGQCVAKPTKEEFEEFSILCTELLGTYILDKLDIRFCSERLVFGDEVLTLQSYD